MIASLQISCGVTRWCNGSSRANLHIIANALASLCCPRSDTHAVKSCKKLRKPRRKREAWSEELEQNPHRCESDLRKRGKTHYVNEDAARARKKEEESSGKRAKRNARAECVTFSCGLLFPHESCLYLLQLQHQSETRSARLPSEPILRKASYQLGISPRIRTCNRSVRAADQSVSWSQRRHD